MLYDTIAAISTPLGEGGIGIVRMTGSQAFSIADKIFRGIKNGDWQEGSSHKLYYGHVVEPETETVVDEILLGVMRAPHTFTREDVVEFNCHGGIVPIRKILELVLNNGARLAEPGEFSKRAFLNGRLDLAQAESIIDVIRAKTETGLKLAISQLKGELSEKINVLQDKLLALLAQIEANIDFPEDDLEDASRQQIGSRSAEMLAEVQDLLAGADTGKIYREGIWTVIVGRPNVGKSSLLNAMLREKRAIVTEIPGTTRDVIEEIINIRGIPLKLADTAGLRETDDIVERIGVEKSRELVEKADLVLVVLDAATGITVEDKEILEMVKDKTSILLVNKVDIGDGEFIAKELSLLSASKPIIKMSVKEGTGLAKLEDQIVEMVLGGAVTASDNVLVSNIRHKQALEKAKRHLQEVVTAITGPVPADLISIDLRGAWEALGEVTGSTVTEDLVDRIFADFCIGK